MCIPKTLGWSHASLSKAATGLGVVIGPALVPLPEEPVSVGHGRGVTGTKKREREGLSCVLSGPRPL